MSADATRRALLVDDDPSATALLRVTLEEAGWTAEVCADGLAAAAALRRASYDLVVINFYLPSLSGIEVYESAARRDPRMARRFLFLSAAAETPAMKQFLARSRCACLVKPVERERFTALAARITGERPARPAEPLAAWFALEGRSLYSGEIAGRHTLFRLMHAIYTGRMTGVLHVVLGRVEKKLYCNRGNLIFAASNLYDEGLGEMMLHAGALRQSDYETAAERVAAGTRFGAALLELGLTDRAGLRRWVQQQITRIAVSAFDYPAGRYYFFDTFEEDLAPEVGIALPVGQLLLEAARTTAGLPLEELAAEAATPVAESADPLLRFQDVALNDAERALLAAIEKPRPPRELLARAGLPGQAGARALYALLALGIVRAGQAEAAAAVLPAAAQPARPFSAEEFDAELRRLLELAARGNYYQLLGVSPAAPAPEIQMQFNSLARVFHPDRHQGSSGRIEQLQQLMDALLTAYRTLADPAARAEYDRGLAAAAAAAEPAHPPPQRESGESCLSQAMACLCVRDLSGALNWLRRAVELEPAVPRYRLKLARMLAALPQYRHEAPEHFERVIALDPVNIAAHFLLGEYYLEQQLPWRARPCYEKILEIDPEHAKARRRIAEIDAPAGEKDQGASLVSRLFRRKEP